jgi:hypothetical protein
LPDEPKRHWTTLIGQGAAHPVAFAVILVYSVLPIASKSNTFAGGRTISS